MKNSDFSKLAAAVLLMAFVFALGNLVFNIENLNIGEDSIPEFINPGGSGSGDVATSSSAGEILRWAYFGFLAFCIIVVIISVISFTASKDRKKWRRFSVQLAALLVICGLFLTFGYYYENIESKVSGGEVTSLLPDGSGGDIGTGGFTEGTGDPDAMKTIITLGVLGVVFMFFIAVFIGINNIFRMRSAKLDYSDIERDSKAVALTIQRTIDAIAGGSDTRATVIRCYTDMCKVMAKYGVKEEEHLTPREFQKIAADNLPVPQEQMKALIDIFEEARYSRHELGKEESGRAVSALEAVREKLLEYRPSAAGKEASGDGR